MSLELYSAYTKILIRTMPYQGFTAAPRRGLVGGYCRRQNPGVRPESDAMWRTNQHTALAMALSHMGCTLQYNTSYNNDLSKKNIIFKTANCLRSLHF